MPMSTRELWWRWQEGGLFNEYWRIKYDPAEGDPEAWETVRDYIRHVEENIRTGTGLMLVGPPGTGKTLMAQRIGRAALVAKQSVLCTTVARYQSAVNDIQTLSGMGRHQAEAAEKAWELTEWLERLSTVKMLILDDLGKEYTSGSGYIEGRLEALIRERGNSRKPTIITTNVAVPEWESTYGSSMASYLHQVQNVVPVVADDHRLKMNRQERIARHAV